MFDLVRMVWNLPLDLLRDGYLAIKILPGLIEDLGALSRLQVKEPDPDD